MCFWVPAADLAQVTSAGPARVPTESQLQLVGGFAGFGRFAHTTGKGVTMAISGETWPYSTFL